MTMSSSLHAFKGNSDPHLHFEDDNGHLLHFKDDNVFSHCMPSKGNNAIIYTLEDDNELTPYNQYEEERAPDLDIFFIEFMAYHASSKANHNAIQKQEIQCAKVFFEDYQVEPELAERPDMIDMCMIRLRLLALNEYRSRVIDILIGSFLGTSLD
ncbi:hypothetical protein JHK85_023015 [Glycine max]|nr:hypothetical protein JHK85_023015 [Glycine max]